MAPGPSSARHSPVILPPGQWDHGFARDCREGRSSRAHPAELRGDRLGGSCTHLFSSRFPELCDLIRDRRHFLRALVVRVVVKLREFLRQRALSLCPHPLDLGLKRPRSSSFGDLTGFCGGCFPCLIGLAGGLGELRSQ